MVINDYGDSWTRDEIDEWLETQTPAFQKVLKGMGRKIIEMARLMDNDVSECLLREFSNLRSLINAGHLLPGELTADTSVLEATRMAKNNIDHAVETYINDQAVAEYATRLLDMTLSEYRTELKESKQKLAAHLEKGENLQPNEKTQWAKQCYILSEQSKKLHEVGEEIIKYQTANPPQVVQTQQQVPDTWWGKIQALAFTVSDITIASQNARAISNAANMGKLQADNNRVQRAILRAQLEAAGKHVPTSLLVDVLY